MQLNHPPVSAIYFTLAVSAIYFTRQELLKAFAIEVIRRDGIPFGILLLTQDPTKT